MVLRQLAAGAAALTTAGAAATAGLVFLDRRRRKRPEPTGYVREVAGARVHYVDEGAGAAVVLVHGLAGSTFSWRSVLPELAKEFRVVAVDLPGFGLSDRRRGIGYGHERQAERLAALLELLGIERAAFVGHSMGGAIVERLAARRPERVERLVLVAPASAGRAAVVASRATVWMAFEAMSVVAASPSVMYALGRRSLRRMVADPAFVTDDVVRGYVDPLLVPGTFRAMREMAIERALEPGIDPGAVGVPALVLAGERDTVVAPAVAEWLAGELPYAGPAVVIERAGHLLAEERPDAFLRAVLPFLRTGSTAQARR
jgi:pimeloyl-ACP methyl ester carboxylesterase